MDSNENPMGTDGFELLEFATSQPEALGQDLENLGFTAVAKHRNRDIVLYRQGDIQFLVNNVSGEFSKNFADIHGPSACAMGFRVKDAQAAFKHAIENGARAYEGELEFTDQKIPTIYGIGNSLIYLIDQHGDSSVYENNFVSLPSKTSDRAEVGLQILDHVTHNVPRGSMDKWADFYINIFNFKEIRFFDIKGVATGLVSRALASPCGKIRIPINEGTDEQSQIEEFLRDYNGEGIQHIALSCGDIYHSVETMLERNVEFMDVPDTYYDAVDQRVAGHQEDLERMRKNRILIDGAPTKGDGVLLQIFTNNTVGPIFFEIIQRKENESFGEGNFQALFEAIERDQIQRGAVQV